MPGKPFTSYLVALATDAAEIARFDESETSARAAMNAAGIHDRGQQDALLYGDQAAIEAAIKAELANADVPSGGSALGVPFISVVHVMMSRRQPGS